MTSSRSVILIKALNGSGKTTLLTALQIGLYGVKAISSGRRADYEELVHSLQRADAVGNAVISIDLIVDIGGAYQAYKPGRSGAISTSSNGSRQGCFIGSYDFPCVAWRFTGHLFHSRCIRRCFRENQPLLVLTNFEKFRQPREKNFNNFQNRCR